MTITFTSTLSPPNPLVVAPTGGLRPGLRLRARGVPLLRAAELRDPGRQRHAAQAAARPGTHDPGHRVAPRRSTPPTSSLDLADDIFDLQVALGFDTDYDSAGSGVGSFDDDTDALGVDDVFYEGADDDAARHRRLARQLERGQPDRRRVPGERARSRRRPVRLYYVRISTLGRTARRDPRYVAPDFDPIAGEDFIENNDYDDAPANVFKTPENRQYRHRLLRTVVDLRNI